MLLKLRETKILKDKQLRLAVETVERTNNGRSSISMKLKRLLRKDSTLSLDSKSTDHSTWSQDFQCRELLKQLEPTIWSLRDGPRVELHNSSHSTMLTRPSDLYNGRTMLLKSNPMEDQAMSTSPQVSTQDGGNSSDMKVPLSPMRKERYSMFKEAKMERIRMS
jgi:hypothetical protein